MSCTFVPLAAQQAHPVAMMPMAQQRQPPAPCRGVAAAPIDAQLCERLTESLDAGPELRARTLGMLRGHVGALAFDAAGCRLVQQAFEVADRHTSSELLAELQGRVCEASRNPHANYVIQKVITVATPPQIAAVARELRGVAPALARHRYGCRILCRLSEHSGSTDKDAAAVVGEVLAQAEQLFQHPFGHHVVQSIVEHGSLEQRRHVATTLLRSNLCQLAADPLSNHIVAAALEHCPEGDAQALSAALVAHGARGVAELGKNRFGVGVLRIVLRASGPASEALRGMLWTAAPQLRNSRYGKVLLREVGIMPAEKVPTGCCEARAAGGRGGSGRRGESGAAMGGA